MAVKEKPEFDWLKKLKIPMIIAVKGGAESSRSNIASCLAGLLHYSHIKENDIPISSHSSSPNSSSSSTDLDDASILRFDIVFQIASTQLDSKNGVIINASFSRDVDLDRLGNLASRVGALLIIIECDSQEDNGNKEDSHDVGDVKIPIDMSISFDAEKLISGLKPIAEAHQKVMEGLHKHLHALADQPTEGPYKLKCKRCLKFVSGPATQCDRCKLVVFHQSCAKLPEIEHVKKENHEYLWATPPDYDQFPEKDRCISCKFHNKELVYDCHDCLLETTLKNKLLPIVLHDVKYHEHALRLVMMPKSSNFEYKCSGCGDFGKCVSYKCQACKFDLHLKCVLIPDEVKHQSHVHPLKLRFQPMENRSSGYYCNVCDGEREPKCWSYCCEECGFVTHTRCIDPAVLGTPK